MNRLQTSQSQILTSISEACVQHFSAKISGLHPQVQVVVIVAQTGLKSFVLCSHTEYYSAPVLFGGEGDVFHSAVKSSGGNMHAFIASGSRLLAPAENIVVCQSIIPFLCLSLSLSLLFSTFLYSTVKRPVMPIC